MHWFYDRRQSPSRSRDTSTAQYHSLIPLVQGSTNICQTFYFLPCDSSQNEHDSDTVRGRFPLKCLCLSHEIPQT